MNHTTLSQAMFDVSKGIRKSEVTTLTVRPWRKSYLWGLSTLQVIDQVDIELVASGLQKKDIEVQVLEIVRDDDGLDLKTAYDVSSLFVKDGIPNNGEFIIKIRVMFEDRCAAAAGSVSLAMSASRYGWLVSAKHNLSYLLYSRLSYCAQNIPNEVVELSGHRIGKEFPESGIAPLDTVILWDAIQKKLPVSFINTGSICLRPVFKVSHRFRFPLFTLVHLSIHIKRVFQP